MEVINYVSKERTASHSPLASLSGQSRYAGTTLSGSSARLAPKHTLNSTYRTPLHSNAIRSGWAATTLTSQRNTAKEHTLGAAKRMPARYAGYAAQLGAPLAAKKIETTLLAATARMPKKKENAAPISPTQATMSAKRLDASATGAKESKLSVSKLSISDVFAERPSAGVAAPSVKAHKAVRRSPLAYIGMFASLLHRTVNKTLPGVMAFITATGIGGILMLGADWYASHTGPLALQDGSTKELDTLSAIMLGNGCVHDDGQCGSADSGVDELDALSAAAGQVIKSTVTWQTYTVRKGDTITGITRRYGLDNLSTIIAVNGVDNARAIQAGKKIRIPSMDGIVHTVSAGNSLAGISAKYNVSVEDILDVNDLSTKELSVGQELFIPGATMDNTALREAMGDLFKPPIRVSYRLSSHFGWRADPFTGVRSYHSGVDMACPMGTPIYAAMGGRVVTAGWSNVFGNYVIIDHRNGYQSLYGHMSKRIALKGQVVNQGDKIGLVGSTGYSTGPHLHFTVYKKGRLTDPLVLLRR